MPVDSEPIGDLNAEGQTPVQVTEEVRVKSKSRFTRKLHFTDAKEEYDPSSDCSSGESGTFGPVQDDLSGERFMRQPRDRMVSGESDSKRRRDRVLSGESRNITDIWEHDDVESFGSKDDSRPQSWDNTSETTSNYDVSEIVIHSLLVD